MHCALLLQQHGSLRDPIPSFRCEMASNAVGIGHDGERRVFRWQTWQRGRSGERLRRRPIAETPGERARPKFFGRRAAEHDDFESTFVRHFGKMPTDVARGVGDDQARAAPTTLNRHLGRYN